MQALFAEAAKPPEARSIDPVSDGMPTAADRAKNGPIVGATYTDWPSVS